MNATANFNADLLKSDLKLIVSNNPQAFKLVIHYAKNQRADEVFETKADFGARLLQQIDNVRTSNIYISQYKRKGFLPYFGSPVETSIINKGQRTGAMKNLESLTITIETKQDSKGIAAQAKQRAGEKRFDSKYQGD